jgi:hypothetical protein
MMPRVQCECVIKNREDNETQREWLKRCMCMYHWMLTDYYQIKLPADQQMKFDFEKDVN